jgi:hypothetical protein
MAASGLCRRAGRFAVPRGPIGGGSKPGRVDLLLLLCCAIGAAGVLAGALLWEVISGALLAAIAAQLFARRRGTVGVVPVLPMLTLALLPAYWLMTTVAGPEGQSIAALRDAPFSEAAEILLIPCLVLPAWGFLSLWPLAPFVPGPVLAPLGVALLVRIGVDILPEGMLHWQPLLAPLIVVALLLGGTAGGWTAVAGALALLGASSATTAGRAGAEIMGVLAMMGGLAAYVRSSEGAVAVMGTAVRARAAAILPFVGAPLAAWAFLLVMTGSLRSQVLYSVLAAAATLLALGAMQRIERVER